MDVYICQDCGAESKEEKPAICPLCKSKEFSENSRVGPTEQDRAFTQLYHDVVKKLDAYDEGCEPRSLAHTYRCSCAHDPQ